MSRYDRLLELSSFSIEKLDKLANKKVLLIGVGGVGQHISTYLITNGIKKLTIVDFDNVELSNLNRQILLTENDVGKAKVEVVKRALEARNSDAKISSLNVKIEIENADNIIFDYDVVIDAVDNWKSKLLISKAAHKAKIPFLHVGVDGESGQFCIFKNKSLSDLFDDEVINEPRDGVMGPMVGLISSFASIELIKFLTDDSTETDVLYHIDESGKKVTKIKLI